MASLCLLWAGLGIALLLGLLGEPSEKQENEKGRRPVLKNENEKEGER